MDPEQRTYREWPARPAGTVAWTRPASDHASTTRILPDGCTDIMWHDDQLVVAGPDTVAQLNHTGPGRPYEALRFAPGLGPAVLGVPGDALRDQRVPLSALWAAGAVRDLTDRLREARTPAARVAILEDTAAERLRRTRPDPVTATIARHLRAGATVAASASAVGLSERQVHRRSLAAFGYGPKTLARILRMQRAVALARAGRAFADVAADAGYADQAHLAREVKALAGVPLGSVG